MRHHTRSGRLDVAWLLWTCVTTACATAPTNSAPPPVIAAMSATFRPTFFSNIGIVVEDETNDIPNQAATLRAIEDLFIRAALSNGYTVAARSDIDKIAAEARLGRDDVLEYAFRDRARALGISALLVVTINGFNTERRDADVRKVGFAYLRSQYTRPRYVGEVAIGVRLIDVERTEVVYVGNFAASALAEERDEHSELVIHVAQRLANELPARTTTWTPSAALMEFTPKTSTISREFDPSVHSRLALYVQESSARLRQEAAVLRRIEDVFMQAALIQGFTVTARSDIERISREFSSQNFPNDEILARRGRALGASGVVIVSVDRADTDRGRSYPNGVDLILLRAEVSARMISTERARVLWVGRHAAESTGVDDIELAPLVAFTARVVASMLPSRR